MKKKRGQKVKKEKGEKFNSRGNQIVTLLQSRNDVTRLMLPELLGITMIQADQAMTGLRIKGIKVFAPKGPGTPLRLAFGQMLSAKYNVYRRSIDLPRAKRMLVSEYVDAEQYKALESKHVELLEIMKNATNGI